jgi:hypothetical protein
MDGGCSLMRPGLEGGWLTGPVTRSTFLEGSPIRPAAEVVQHVLRGRAHSTELRAHFAGAPFPWDVVRRHAGRGEWSSIELFFSCIVLYLEGSFHGNCAAQGRHLTWQAEEWTTETAGESVLCGGKNPPEFRHVLHICREISVDRSNHCYPPGR